MVYHYYDISDVEYIHSSGFTICVSPFTDKSTIHDPVTNLYLWRDSQWRRFPRTVSPLQHKQGVWTNRNTAIAFLNNWWDSLPQTRKDKYFAKYISYRILKEK